MKKLILVLLIIPSFSKAFDNNSQAAKDLAIIEGEYAVTNGSISFCSAGGPVGWVKTEKSDTNKDAYMLMLGTRFIFSDINKPEQKQIISECEYITKSETKKVDGAGILIETETQKCKSMTQTTRRKVHFERDKINLEVAVKTEENGQKKNVTSECSFALKSASRFQQSVPK